MNFSTRILEKISSGRRYAYLLEYERIIESILLDELSNYRNIIIDYDNNRVDQINFSILSNESIMLSFKFIVYDNHEIDILNYSSNPLLFFGNAKILATKIVSICNSRMRV